VSLAFPCGKKKRKEPGKCEFGGGTFCTIWLGQSVPREKKKSWARRKFSRGRGNLFQRRGGENFFLSTGWDPWVFDGLCGFLKGGTGVASFIRGTSGKKKKSYSGGEGGKNREIGEKEGRAKIGPNSNLKDVAHRSCFRMYRGNKDRKKKVSGVKE